MSVLLYQIRRPSVAAEMERATATKFTSVCLLEVLGGSPNSQCFDISIIDVL